MTSPTQEYVSHGSKTDVTSLALPAGSIPLAGVGGSSVLIHRPSLAMMARGVPRCQDIHTYARRGAGGWAGLQGEPLLVRDQRSVPLILSTR